MARPENRYTSWLIRSETPAPGSGGIVRLDRPQKRKTPAGEEKSAGVSHMERGILGGMISALVSFGAREERSDRISTLDVC